MAGTRQDSMLQVLAVDFLENPYKKYVTFPIGGVMIGEQKINGSYYRMGEKHSGYYQVTTKNMKIGGNNGIYGIYGIYGKMCGTGGNNGIYGNNDKEGMGYKFEVNE